MSRKTCHKPKPDSALYSVQVFVSWYVVNFNTDIPYIPKNHFFWTNLIFFVSLPKNIGLFHVVTPWPDCTPVILLWRPADDDGCMPGVCINVSSPVILSYPSHTTQHMKHQSEMFELFPICCFVFLLHQLVG